MPLLPPEPAVSPADLFTRPPDGGDARWWVLHTRPRAEKSLARRLLNRHAYFLPQYPKRWRNRGRLLESHLPLFPGYLFLRGDEQARLEALQTNLVAATLPGVDQRQLHDELTRVWRLVASGAPLAPEERLVPGTWVEITRGPLAGLEGKVLKRGRKWTFVVEVQLLARGVGVEIEQGILQPLAARDPQVAARAPAGAGA